MKRHLNEKTFILNAKFSKVRSSPEEFDVKFFSIERPVATFIEKKKRIVEFLGEIRTKTQNLQSAKISKVKPSFSVTYIAFFVSN